MGGVLIGGEVRVGVVCSWGGDIAGIVDVETLPTSFLSMGVVDEIGVLAFG